MTISAYTGLPGHGKSYGVVENVIASALKAKREVFTNIPMNDSECLKRFKMTVTHFKTEDILENPKWWNEVFTSGAVIVIDELWRLWPSGLNAKNVREEDKAFLAEHRHMVGNNGASTEIVFVTQDLSQIANFARSLVETTFRVTKLSKIGMEKRFRVDVYFGPVTGASPPASKRDREVHGKFRKEIYQLYKSHTKSETGVAGNETRIDGRFNSLGGISIKIGLVAIVLCSFMVYYGFKFVTAYYGGNNSKPPSNQQPASHKISNTQSGQVKKPAPSIFRFLSKAEAVFLTGKMQTNYQNGRSKIDYFFEISFKDSVVNMTQHELTKLGYEYQPINDCMMILRGQDFNGYALCRKQEADNTWIDSLVSPTATE